MSDQYDIKIDFDLTINPRTPFKTNLEELKIRNIETYLKYNVHILISALEKKLNAEFNTEDIENYGIKPIQLKESL